MRPVSREGWLILGLALLKVIIHLATNTNYELQRDALLYYSLGENPAWGYVSVPPLIALLAKASTTLLGNTVFALRLLPALIGGLSVVVIARIVQMLKGKTMAIILATTAFIFSPAFLRSNTLFQPVSFNQFFWLLAGFLLVRMLITQKTHHWLYIFAILGIAFLNKYSVAFFIVAVLLGLLLTRQRKLLISRYFFIGGTMALLIILPNLILATRAGYSCPMGTSMS